jgi:hypothetical protein
MQPVRSIKNQYPGINAHLHSYWQGAKKWNRFHNFYIGRLMASLKVQLIPLGYTAEMEESLQIRRVGDDLYNPKADILLSDLKLRGERQPYILSSPAAQIMMIDELVEFEQDREHPYFSLAIYERSNPGDPIAWIELLSPSNKGGRLDAQTYLDKRRELLRSGLVFVELDYLHETPSTFETIPDYTRHEPKSSPYRMVVLDPHPDFNVGPAYLYAFNVDQAMPKVKIPLKGKDVLEFDFEAVYQQVFEEGVYGYDVDFDYTQLPMNFDRYRPDDQARIVSRMLAVLKAAHAGIDLEANAPLPVEQVSLEDGLKRLAEWQSLAS